MVAELSHSVAGTVAGKGQRPIYFVNLLDYVDAIGDGALTVSELEGLPSMLIGYTTTYQYVQLNSGRTNSFPTMRDGHSQTVAHGVLNDGQRLSSIAIRKDPTTSRPSRSTSSEALNLRRGALTPRSGPLRHAGRVRSRLNEHPVSGGGSGRCGVAFRVKVSQSRHRSLQAKGNGPR